MINFTAHFVKRKRQKQEKAKQMFILQADRSRILGVGYQSAKEGGQGGLSYNRAPVSKKTNVN